MTDTTSRPPAQWPDDVRQMIHRRFARQDIVGVYELLSPLSAASDVLLRAVLLLADGSLAQLKHYVDVGHRAAEDVIHWAEYDDRVGSPDVRTRDLSQPVVDEFSG